MISPRHIWIWRALLALALAAALVLVPRSAAGEDRRHYSIFGGTMTEGRWYEALSPGTVEFAGSSLVGASVAWERQIGASRFSYGIEAQMVAHFGRQDHFEFNLPVTLRYTPRRPWPPRFKSAAFGVGLSHATKIPQVEIDRKGLSQRNYVYWMAEAEFDLPRPEDSVYLRLHHRSDGYGIYDVSSGSTGIVLGWRREF